MSDDVKLMIILHPSNKNHALNDRTLNLLMKCKIDMNAVPGGVDAPKFSDAEISSALDQETEVFIAVV